VQRELTGLVSAGILERSVRGRQVYYQADRRCPVFEELRSIVTKTSGLADPLRASLTTLASRIDAAFVFGSLAAAGGSPQSDVDVFVVGKVTLGQVVDALANSEQALGREINPVVQSPDEFSRRVAAGDHFVTRVLADSKLYLIGDDDVLGRLGAGGVADATSHQPAGNQRAARDRPARPARQPGPRRQR
jgi:predicted nucleotidyltransferase